MQQNIQTLRDNGYRVEAWATPRPRYRSGIVFLLSERAERGPACASTCSADPPLRAQPTRPRLHQGRHGSRVGAVAGSVIIIGQ
jgi:hypothetical protein